MIIIIPIGGNGKRFKNHGYKKPKALINIFGKPILSYLLDNINTQNIDYIFIPYNVEYKSYRLEDFLIKTYPKMNFRFLCLESNTRGAAETINIGISKLNEDRNIPVLCLDSDSFYGCDIISQWDGNNCIFTFEDMDKNPIYSFIETNENDEIINIEEKEPISNLACTGAYGFKYIDELKRYTTKIIQENITQKSEFYTSGVIKEMVRDGLVFKNRTIEEKDIFCLGTPVQLKLFHNYFSYNNVLNNEIGIEKKRICFDLDNTLVTFPSVINDYTSVRPIQKNINFLKFMKAVGNTIIIYTSRRMKTHNGNIGKVYADIGKVTFETLDKFSIPYDEIYFGKPNADFYIDDLAINCFDNFEKELGYYDNKIEPRYFHTINAHSFETIIKNGDLKGENYYYENIPKSLKELFPLYISGNESTITIEKIHGISVTELYLSKMINDNLFIYILNSINQIHNCDIIIDKDNNLYGNYSAKLIKRYKEYDYTPFEKSKEIYGKILKDLQNYEKQNLGKQKVIHGDPVFTNIMINKYGKIKFIDMRGKIGDKLTIYGDWLYDWAKVYQSLIGYDEILSCKSLDHDYKTRLINLFKTYFIRLFSEEDFNNLKLITKSLLFTLIPLHNNEKCKQYYNLIFSHYLS